MVPAPPPLLVDRLARGKCVVFAGAGVSMAAKLPSWTSLLSELVAELKSSDSVEIDKLKSWIKQGKLLEVADHCQEKLGEDRFRRFLVERFGGTQEASHLHRQIARLPLPGVITTNYDKLFENAYGGRLTVRTQADKTLASLPFDPAPFLLKAHGDIAQPETLILTARDYRRLIHSNPQFKSVFDWIQTGNAILFLGYSLSDPDFNLFLQGHFELLGGMAGRYALLSEIGEVERGYLQRIAGIEVLEYPVDRHDLVEDFLAELILRTTSAVVEIEPQQPDKKTSTEGVNNFRVQFEHLSGTDRARLLARPRAEQETALRSCYGEEGWLEMRRGSLAQVRRRDVKRGHVIVIPDLFGSELTLYHRNRGKNIWLNLPRLFWGQIARLQLREDGTSDYDVRATGVLRRAYANLLLSLASQTWDVHVFWYDWRQEFDVVAGELHAQIQKWFAKGEPVHFLTHGSGGLAARAFIKNYPGEWDALLDRESPVQGSRGGRLIMLDSPHHGYLVMPQLLTGTADVLGKLAILDLKHNLEQIRNIFASWPALYQLLPSPLAIPAFDLFYRRESYGDIAVSQRHLDRARDFHVSIEKIVDPERMTSILSDKPLALAGTRTAASLAAKTLSSLAAEPHAANQLAQLKTATGEMVPTYYSNVPHGSLPNDEKIISALDDLLETGMTFSLRKSPKIKETDG